MVAYINRMKEALKGSGVKQTWLDEKFGKSFSVVNFYVCNRRQPSLEELFEMLKIFQVNLKYLISN